MRASGTGWRVYNCRSGTIASEDGTINVAVGGGCDRSMGNHVGLIVNCRCIRQGHIRVCRTELDICCWGRINNGRRRRVANEVISPVCRCVAIGRRRANILDYLQNVADRSDISDVRSSQTQAPWLRSTLHSSSPPSMRESRVHTSNNDPSRPIPGYSRAIPDRRPWYSRSRPWRISVDVFARRRMRSAASGRKQSEKRETRHTEGCVSSSHIAARILEL